MKSPIDIKIYAYFCRKIFNISNFNDKEQFRLKEFYKKLSNARCLVPQSLYPHTVRSAVKPT